MKKDMAFIIFKCYSLNRYNIRMISTIDFLFSTFHTILFLYVDRCLAEAQCLCYDVTRSDMEFKTATSSGWNV